MVSSHLSGLCGTKSLILVLVERPIGIVEAWQGRGLAHDFSLLMSKFIEERNR